MATKATAAFSILATVAALFAFSVSTEAKREPAREAAAPKERVFLVGSFPVGDFIGPMENFDADAKIEGHTKKEIIEAFNRCKILVFDRMESSGNGWTFPPIHGNSWPKFLLEGQTLFRLTDKKGTDVTLAIKSVEMGGSTTLPKKRKVGITVFVRRINQGDPSNNNGVLWVTHQFEGRLLEYDCEGKAVLFPAKHR